MKQFPKELTGKFQVPNHPQTPTEIQNFLNKLPQNFSPYTCHSPSEALKNRKANCFEGALLAAALLWRLGERPLLLDLETTRADVCHVVALFKRNGLWGAVSKTNHAVLRFRDPIFQTPRELALSYFNEYFLDNGQKTLRRYSAPFDLTKLEPSWLTSQKPLWKLETALGKSPHFPIVPVAALKKLRLADPIEIKAGKIKGVGS